MSLKQKILSFAAIILVLGIAQAILGIVMLCNYDWIADLMALAKSSGKPLLEHVDISIWERNVSFLSSSLALIGSIYIISSVGLFHLSNWGRILWLFIISFSLVFYVAWFILDTINGHVDFGNWIEIFIVITIFSFSWWYLSSPIVREIFNT